MAEKKRVVKEGRRRVTYKPQFAHLHPDGRRCRNRCWAGKEYCFQHDTEAAELRAMAGGPSYAKASEGGPVRLMSVAEVQAALTRTLADLQERRIKPSEAYAAGYLAQLALTALGVAKKVGKLDVKHFWEMVDLGAAIETAAKLQKEREKEVERKEAEEAQEAKEAEQAEEAREVDVAEAKDDLSG